VNAPSSFAGWAAAAVMILMTSGASAATLSAHPEVADGAIEAAAVRPAGGAWRAAPWGDLGTTALDPGRYEVRVRFASERPGESLEVPPCAGRHAIRLDAREVDSAPGPVVVPVSEGRHELVVDVDVSRYERRIACGHPPRVGLARETTEGLGTLVFESPHAGQGGGKAVVYVPPGRDLHAFSALLVGLHPWNGTPWTYAAYDDLLREARARGVLLLMPSGLGNSLYTADAEDEVLRAIDAMADVVRGGESAPMTVSLWGASMGGAGATTIGFHHPDRFAAITSFFGDSRYDLSTYVRSILRDPFAAHEVNALDIVDNARHVPVWLVHGEADVTSPIRQSEMLADALRQHGFQVRFDRVPNLGHSGALVARFIPEIVAAAASARTVSDPARITYWSVRPSDDGAYGVHVARASATGDAFLDVERRDDGVHVLRADGIRALSFDPGAMGTPVASPPRIVVDYLRSTVAASWGPSR
jgi:pimeloyl-ACP methyl ester carboxylesterase